MYVGADGEGEGEGEGAYVGADGEGAVMNIKTWFDRGLLSFVIVIVTAVLAINSLFTRARMSHENGIVGRGRLKLLDNTTFPRHSFFSSGEEFQCRIRHASVTYMDDTALVVRAASLKLADQNHESPLDLLMNTGETAPFYNVWTFVQFMYLTIRGRNPHAIPFMKKYPLAAQGVQVSLRHNPQSFALMSYHSKTPLLFLARDGVDRYVKFRLLPEHDLPETGRTDALSLETPWEQQASPGETRSPHYLKDEYKKRVERHGVRYRLQLQLHEADENERREIVLNSSIAWDETVCPWQDVATLEIDSILPYEAGNKSTFSLSNHPPSLAFIPPRSIHDPPSLELLRRRGVWARRARLLGYRLFGMPKQATNRRADIDSTKRSEFVLPSQEVPRLPQNVEPEGRRERQQALEAARGQYKWGGDRGLPPFVREVPKAEQFTSEKDARILMDIGGSILDLGVGFIEDLTAGDHHTLFEEYKWLYPIRSIPSVSKRLDRDDEFGRQRLAGVNPVLIERCQQLPEHFAVDDALVKSFLRKGETLADAMAESRLYLTDYSAIDGLPIVDGRYVTAPMCLLYVNPSKQLVPIAVQLGQSPDSGPVFTPNDPYWLWQAAKTWVQTADAQYHEANSHLLRTHMVMEPFAVAAARQLSGSHPVYCLLRPHFADTMAINHSARTSMLAPEGAIDQTMALGADGTLEAAKRGYADWKFDRYALRTDLRIRGVDDCEALPGYHYRDDALLLWDAIDDFVGSVVRHVYADEGQIAADTELQAWVRELASQDGGCVRGLPNDGEFRTRSELHQVLTQIIFTCSAEHASVNNGQYEIFGYPPNVPAAMYQPPPQTREEMSEVTLAHALPPRRAAAAQVGMVHLLSMRTKDPLGHYPPDFFLGDPQVVEFAHRFSTRLADISAQIGQRNDALEVGYTYLDPIQIGQSIAI